MEKISVAKVKDLVKKDEWVVIYAYSKACKTCKKFTPELENEILPNLKTDVKFYKINLEDKRQNQNKLKMFADNIQLDSVPFCAVFHDGHYRGADNFSSKEGFNKLMQMIKVFKVRQNDQTH